MYVTVRRYTNAAALGDAMAANRKDVEDVIAGVSGFVSYYSSRDGDTLTSITVCNDKAGCDESTRLAGEWVREHVKSLPSAPEVSGGEVFIKF